MIVKFKKNVKDETVKVKKNIIKIKKEIVSFFKEKGKMKKIKRWAQKIWSFCIKKEVLLVLLLACPFIFMDLIVRIFGHSISFYSLFSIPPRLFSLAYIILFVGISLNIKKKYSKFLYSVLFSIFFVLFFV